MQLKQNGAIAEPQAFQLQVFQQRFVQNRIVQGQAVEFLFSHEEDCDLRSRGELSKALDIQHELVRSQLR